jgi:threonine dehydratase
VNRIERIIHRGLIADGRLARLHVDGPDRPGLLAQVSATVARLGGNIMDVYHRRDASGIPIGTVSIVVDVETRGRVHADQIVRELSGDGLRVSAADPSSSSSAP